MDMVLPPEVPKSFAAPQDFFSGLDSSVAATLITAATDIALVLTADGTVADVAFGNAELAQCGLGGWVGQPWIDTVTRESKPKIQDLLRDSRARGLSSWRQVNHAVPGGGADIPVRYCTVRLGSNGTILAIGRDLRAMAVLQKRLAEAQQTMEREYARIRGAETRYRLLFQLCSEAVLIVDAATGRVGEANPAAARLLGRDAKRMVGQAIPDLFDDSSQSAIQSLMAAARVTGRVEDVHARLSGGGDSILLSASLFRQDSASHILIRLRSLGADQVAPASPVQSSVLKVVESLPEAFIVTDLDGAVLAANTAFLDLAQLATEDQVRGEPLARWIGRPGIDTEVLFENLKTHGSVRSFSTILRGEYGTTDDVDVAGVAVLGGETPCLGFTIRSSGWRSGVGALAGRELPRSVEQFTDLVGRVPLKNLVRETTDMIERLCIEAALELTKDNRASAAEMLGLSRQSLYAKLRRYGLGDLDGIEDEAE